MTDNKDVGWDMFVPPDLLSRTQLM